MMQLREERLLQRRSTIIRMTRVMSKRTRRKRKEVVI
jgi:hypothetical protein